MYAVLLEEDDSSIKVSPELFETHGVRKVARKSDLNMRSKAVILPSVFYWSPR